VPPKARFGALGRRMSETTTARLPSRSSGHSPAPTSATYSHESKPTNPRPHAHSMTTELPDSSTSPGFVGNRQVKPEYSIHRLNSIAQQKSRVGGSTRQRANR
jgi:hypothetical protein